MSEVKRSYVAEQVLKALDKLPAYRLADVDRWARREVVNALGLPRLLKLLAWTQWQSGREVLWSELEDAGHAPDLNAAFFGAERIQKRDAAVHAWLLANNIESLPCPDLPS